MLARETRSGVGVSLLLLPLTNRRKRLIPLTSPKIPLHILEVFLSPTVDLNFGECRRDFSVRWDIHVAVCPRCVAVSQQCSQAGHGQGCCTPGTQIQEAAPPFVSAASEQGGCWCFTLLLPVFCFTVCLLCPHCAFLLPRVR